MPKVSVILPVFNAEKYLREAIDSIVEQSFSDWELIVVNDGSTDGSEKIIRSYTDTRIQYHNNEHNIGLIATLNKATQLCKGQYIARMDADDISARKRLEMQVNFLDRHPEYAMCGTYAKIIDEKNQETGKILNLEDDQNLRINLLFSVPFVHPSMMFRQEVLLQNQYDPEFKHAEDYDLWCRIAKDHKVANIPHFLLKYRWHTNNVSVTHQETQDTLKSKIMARELSLLGLSPSVVELYLHRITFEQFDAKDQLEKKRFEKYDELGSWFQKIIDANRLKKRYNEVSLVAFLWSRWVVLCISQKRYGLILTPRFASYQPAILKKWMRLILFLRKKA